jgi:hypothetical protein
MKEEQNTNMRENIQNEEYGFHTRLSIYYM